MYIAFRFFITNIRSRWVKKFIHQFDIKINPNFDRNDKIKILKDHDFKIN